MCALSAKNKTKTKQQQQQNPKPPGWDSEGVYARSDHTMFKLHWTRINQSRNKDQQ